MNKKVLSLCIAVLFVLALAGCGSTESAPQSEESAEPAEVNMDNVTVNTQNSIRIEGSKIVYIDPYKISEAVCDADIILLTHSHYDHFDEASLKNVIKDDTAIICPFEVSKPLSDMEVQADVMSMEPGTSTAVKDVQIETVPAYNKDKKYHPEDKGWLGFIVTIDGVRYYAAGDTDAVKELNDVECDVAFVPVGGKYTMNAEEAAGLINKIKPKYAVPTHYGSIVGKAADADTFAENVNEGISVVKKVEDAK